MITDAFDFHVHFIGIPEYFYCRDCGAILPLDRHDLGFCADCWRPFAARYGTYNAKANRLALMAAKAEREGQK